MVKVWGSPVWGARLSIDVDNHSLEQGGHYVFKRTEEISTGMDVTEEILENVWFNHVQGKFGESPNFTLVYARLEADFIQKFYGALLFKMYAEVHVYVKQASPLTGIEIAAIITALAAIGGIALKALLLWVGWQILEPILGLGPLGSIIIILIGFVLVLVYLGWKPLKRKGR